MGKKINAFFEPEPTWALAPILFIAAILFAPCLLNDFVNWDDQLFVTQNPVVAAPLFQNLGDVFTSHIMGLYYPLSILGFQIQHSLFQYQPFFYHLVNLLFHLANIALLFFILLQLRLGRKISALSTLLFAIHPLQVEAVAWVSSFKDLFYSFWYLQAILYYLKHREDRNVLRRQMVVTLFFILAMLSKISAITLPVVLVLLDYYLDRKAIVRSCRTHVPLFVVAMVFVGINLLTLRLDDACPATHGMSFINRILLSGYAFGVYLAKIFFPYGLSVTYPLPDVQHGFFPGEVYVINGILVGILALLLKGWRYFRPYSLPLLFFLLMMAPGLHLVKVSNNLIYERYVYLPAVGIFIFLGLVLRAIWQMTSSRGRSAILVGVLFYVSFLAGMTWDRCFVWHNSQTLWTDAIAKSPTSPQPRCFRASYFFEQGEDEKAAADAWQAIKLDGTYSYPYRILAEIAHQKKNLPDAIAYYSKAIELGFLYKKDRWETLNNRGNIYDEMGQTDLAIADYSQVLQENPAALFPLLNRGMIYFRQKDFLKARADFEAALKLAPKNAYARRMIEKMEGR